jgi:ribulose-5-phosphate 4-epimerase/fuculose-1-phosphate aldolase
VTDLIRLREGLLATCRRLAAAGLSPGGSGNVSVRDGGTVLITPTGSALARVQAEELAACELGPDGTARLRDGRAPSKELPLHLAVYAAAPTARAVVHLHSAAASALACLPPDDAGRAALPAYTPYRVMRLGHVPVAAYARPGSASLAAGVRTLASDAPVLLLAAHGPVTWGATLDIAADLAEELENAAQVAFLLRGSAAVPLSAEQIAELQGPAGA